MTGWLIAIVIGAVFALLQYGRRLVGGSPGAGIVGAAVARLSAVSLLVALLLNVPAGRSRPAPQWVALDVSESMIRGDSSVWLAALDSVAAIRAESTFAFGDSVRTLVPNTVPGDRLSAIRPLADRAGIQGKPIVVVTDGELQDHGMAVELPPGSRLIVLPRRNLPDVSISRLDAPRSVLVGDSIRLSVSLKGGHGASGEGTLVVDLDGRELERLRVPSMAAGEDLQIHFDVAIPGPTGPGLLRAVLGIDGDVEPANDTLVAVLQRTEAAEAVFVTTSPDLDSRAAIGILQGALSISTRAFLRVAPGMWRVDGSLAPVSEVEVRRALRDAPVAILHGDTAVFGPPRDSAVTRGTLGLLVPAVSGQLNEEWYATDAPASPLSAALTGVWWDSLPPIAVGDPPRGDWVGLRARRGRGTAPQAVVAATERPRRVVVVAATGLWRWSASGAAGGAADAQHALWGSIFDWLAAERPDMRSAMPDAASFRSGSPIRWRRGGAADSVATVVVRRQDGIGRADSLVLRFGESATAETATLDPGVYEVEAKGGASLLAVNRSAEWIAQPGKANARVGGSPLPPGAGPRLRQYGWVYVAIIALLCGEWLLRRRVGLR